MELKRKTNDKISSLNLDRILSGYLGEIYQQCKNEEELELVKRIIIKNANQLNEFYKSDEGIVYLEE